MLHKLALHGVGPATDLTMNPIAERLNLLTGDNGLGKSFLLEAAWWSLTRTWHETPAVPSQPDAKLTHHFDGSSGKVNKGTSHWDAKKQEWVRRPVGRPANPGLVMYARADGSFSIWDPARNYRLYKRADGGESESPAAYQFKPSEVLWGLERRVQSAGQWRTEKLCLGLVDQWREWQRAQTSTFDLLVALLSHLGSEDQPLSPGDLIRPTIDDVREIPTIRMAYGQDVPITYAPAGVRRMCKLAYLLAWALSEHRIESERVGIEPSKQIILLVDELETHLHPKWQRTVVPSLLEAIETAWPSDTKPDLQLLVATHSPLILTSVEPMFDTQRDALWKLDLVDGKVTIERDAWHKRGDVGMWLASDVFDETVPYSVEAQQAMEHVKALMRNDDATDEEVEQAHKDLARVLADSDPFWIHWRAWKRSKAVAE